MAFLPPQLEDFIFTEKLGKGTYATVYKAFRKSGEHRDVLAIKCVKKSSLNKVSVENLLVEIEILKQMKHEHVVQLVDFQWDSSYIYLIMEYCGGGDLSTFIHAKRILPEHIAKRFLQQLASAIQYLHSYNISHMDLKPQNILLTSVHQPILKIADFGFAQYVDATQDFSIRGSPLYMAPEMVLRHSYDAKVDLWSIGVILYESLFGQTPFGGARSMDDLISKITSDQPVEVPASPVVSSNCRDLLTRLLKRNPEERISFEEFFLHPFVDLEHKPSAESLSKATTILNEAVKADKGGDIKKAATLYSQAVEHLVPAIYYEQDQVKKAALRKKVKEYCNRAEVLKDLSKPNKPASHEAAKQQLLDLCRDDPTLLHAVQVLFIGGTKEAQEKYDEALELYTKAIGRLLPILENEPASVRKDLLRSQIEIHLKRAESIRNYISVNKVNLPEAASSKSSLYSEESNSRCSVQ